MIEKNDQHEFLIKGTLDFNNAPALLNEACRVVDQTTKEVIFNFSQLEQSNSSALSVLLSLLRYAQTKQKNIRFLNLPDNLQAAAKISDLDKILPCM